MGRARVLKRSDEYMRGRTCRCCKAVNSKKLQPAPFCANRVFIGTACTDGLSTVVERLARAPAKTRNLGLPLNATEELGRDLPGINHAESWLET